jgi:hypothetical protein
MFGQRFNIYMNTTNSKMYRVSQTPDGTVYNHMLDKPLQDKTKKGGFIMITPDMQVIYLNKTLQFNSSGKPVTPVPENDPDTITIKK